MNPRGANMQHSAWHRRMERGNACHSAEELLKLGSQPADNLNKAQNRASENTNDWRPAAPLNFQTGKSPVKREWAVGPRTKYFRQFSPLAARRSLNKTANLAQTRELAA